MAITIQIARADREAAFGNATDDELPGIDIEASVEKLDALTLAAVSESYPQAEVELGNGLHVYPESHPGETAITADVVAEAERIHRSEDWLIYI